MDEFLQRLKERKLVQWALAYAAAAFALLQGLDIVAQQFGWPGGVRRAITIALLIGFFVTLVLAWYHGERGAQRVSGTELLILALLLAIGGAILWRFAPGMRETGPTAQSDAARPAAGDRSVVAQKDSRSAAIDRKSIAVLPFENLSEDKANAYFASGMQDMILTKLSGIGDMKVISRTSTQKYASHPDNLKSIALELGVATILEGSVQRAGNDVLINVQLIDANTDAHLWADAYPRTLENIFGVEGEVAQKVAEALHTALTRDERSALAQKPTNNVAAYEAYLKGLALTRSGAATSVDEVADEFRTAVRLDPGFTLAWSELVWQELNAYWFGYDATRKRLAAAKTALDRAEALAPDLPQVEMARAEYLYHGLRDFAGAMTAIRKAQRGLPNDARVWFVAAMIERRMGKWEDALADYAHALALDPNDLTIKLDVNMTLIALHRFAEALPAIKASIAELLLQPRFEGLADLQIFVEWNLGGLDAAEGTLASLTANSGAVIGLHAMQAFYRRDFKKASELFRQAVASGDDAHSELFVAAFLPARIGWQLLQAMSEKRGGSAATAAQIYRHVQEQARAGLAAKSGSLNADVAWHIVLGEASAGLDQREAAVAEGQAAVDMIPESIDAYEGPYWQDCFARIYSINGDVAHAVPLIEHLLRTNGSMITPAMLKLDPVWDPLRDDPEFKKLLEIRPEAATHG